MSKAKVNSPHGGRGPQPQTFDRWVAATAKRGAKRFRVTLPDTTTKLVAHKNAPDSAKRMLAMAPTKVEGLDEKDAELGAWTFSEVEPDPADAPGYLHEEGDSEPERLLKTFARLLADAHRSANKQLVDVVGIQSRNFAEERKNLLNLQLTSERLLAKRLRGMPRVRIAEGEEGEGEGEGEGAGDDTFLQDLLQPMLERMAARMGHHIADGTAGAPNGESKETKS